MPTVGSADGLLLEPSSGAREFGEAASTSISWQATKKPRRCMRSFCGAVAGGCLLIGLATIILVHGLVGGDGGAPGPGGEPNARPTVPCAPCQSGLCVRGECVPEGMSPLHYYLNLTDTEYNWELVEHKPMQGATAYILNLTSQRWLTDQHSDRSVWWHQLAVCVPDNINPAAVHTGWLWITGGHNENDGSQTFDTSDSEFQIAAQLAKATGTIGSVLKQVPNQPVKFTHEIPHPVGFYENGRTEDAIIAYTWNHFVSHPHDAEWLLRLPMTKAASRAMDAIQQFADCGYCESWAKWQMLSKGQPSKVTQFVVGGASKRGWTTWTTGVADTRVAAIVPVVMDLLNLLPNAAHFWAALGGWTFEFEDYVTAGFTSQLGNPNTQRMADIVDPYSYFRHQSPWAPSAQSKNFAQMPKLVVMPDDTHLWWDHLPGEKHFLMLPNADHPLGWHNVNGLGEGNGTLIFAEAALAFYSSVVGRGGDDGKWIDNERPTMTWQITYENVGTEEESAEIKVGNFSSNWQQPISVKTYHATTLDDKRRDWRLFDCVHEHGCTEMEASPGKFPDAGPMPHPCIYREGPQLLLQTDSNGESVYFSKMKRPANGGWTAFFVAFELPSPLATAHFHFTTEVAIVPTTMPFESCAPFGGAQCTDRLV